MSQPVFARALAKAGTGRALGKALGRPEQQISNWKKGRDPIPVDALAELAIYVGDDPIQTLAAERGGAWARVAQALRDKVSAGFDWLGLTAKPRVRMIAAR